MAYLRKVILTAGDSVDGAIISDLHIKFEVVRDRTFKANNAKIKIYNPAESTINNILKEGNSIVLEAGYEDEGTGVIYIGQITSSIPRYPGTDVIVEIESNSLQGDSEKLQAVTLSLTYAPGNYLKGVLENIAKIMNLAVYGIDEVSKVLLPNGYVFTGTPKAALKYCREILEKDGLIVYIDNNSIIISKEVNPPQVTTVELIPASGLLSASKMKTTKDKGKEDEKKLANKIVFKSILNPNVGPNVFLSVDNLRDIKGLYVVDKCTFTGANFGTAPYTVRGEAIEG